MQFWKNLLNKVYSYELKSNYMSLQATQLHYDMGMLVRHHFIIDSSLCDLL